MLNHSDLLITHVLYTCVCKYVSMYECMFLDKTKNKVNQPEANHMPRTLVKSDPWFRKIKASLS